MEEREEAKTHLRLVFSLTSGILKVCRFFIERGADAVICHQVHVPGAYEWHQEKPIFYSLGNLIMDHPNPPGNWYQGNAVRLASKEGGLASADVEIIPYTQSVEQGGHQDERG